MKSGFCTIVATAWVCLLGGCATTHPVDHTLRVSSGMRQEVKRLFDHDRASNQMVYRLAAAGADECADGPLRYRAPFSLLYNSGDLPSAEMRAAIFEMEGLEDQALLQTHDTALQAYDGAHVVAVNGASTTDPMKVLNATVQAMRDQKPISVKLEDGRTFEAKGQPACPSLIFYDATGKAVSAEALGILELDPTAWGQVVHTPDEMAFVLARSIYFTGAEGELKLRHALYAGAAVSGLLRAVTFGISALVADPKHIAMQARRRASWTDADAFAVRLMRRAGFDPKAALAFAQRSLDEGASWPKACDELRFDQARLDALRAQL